MAVIETLSVALTARTQRFTSGIKRAGGQLSRFSKRVAKITAKVAAFGLGLTGLAGGGLLLFANAQRDVIDQTAKFADVVGLSTEALTGYQLAAKITGVEQSQLNTGLQRFQKSIADAQSGLSTAKRVFQNLGLDPARLSLLSMDEAFKTVADRLPTIQNQFQRTQTVLDLFGRSGLALTKLLETGRDGINRFQAEADKLGLAFSRVDAAKVEAANDAVARLQGLFTGISRTLIIEVSPFIEAFAQRLVDAGITGEGVGQRVLQVFTRVASTLAQVVDIVHLLSAAWNGFRSVVEGVTGVVLTALGAIAEGITNLLNKIPGIDIQGENFALTLGADLIKAAEKSFVKSQISFGKFSEQAASNTVKDFFSGVARRADTAAQNAISPAQNAIAEQQSTSAKSNDFGARDIDRVNVFVGALNTSKRQEQRVTDPTVARKLDRTNQLLANMVGGGGAVAV